MAAVTWSRSDETSGNRAIFLYDVSKGAKHQVTSGYFTDSNPVFDPDGKYLFFTSDRELIHRALGKVNGVQIGPQD